MKDKTSTDVLSWGTIIILVFTVLLYIALPSWVTISIWTLMVIFGGMFYVAGLAYVYVFRLDSPITANPEGKDSMNFSVPLISLRGEGIFKSGLEVWGRHGFGSTLFAWKDSKYDLYSTDLAPKQMSPESKIFLTPASLQPINDNILNGIFPTIRDVLMSNPNSDYQPKRVLGAFTGLLHYREADYDKTQALVSAFSRGGLITPARRIVNAPELEAIKIMRQMEAATKKKGFMATVKGFFTGSGKEQGEDDGKEQERAKEGLVP